MNEHVLRLSAAALLGLTLVACQVSPTPTPAPTVEPTATSVPTRTPTSVPSSIATLVPTDTPTPVPTSTATLVSTNTATRRPTSTATPWPRGKVDTGMGGSLTIRGVVRDDSGKTDPNVFVFLEVNKPDGSKYYSLYTDETGSYSFNNIPRLESGSYEVWFNGRQEYGKVYESSGYKYYGAPPIRGDVHVLDVTVHAVTGSVFSGVIRYEDVDGSIKDFYSPPFTKQAKDHLILLCRGTPEKYEYDTGAEYGEISGNTIEWRGLAGGIYHLQFTYRRLDGVLVRCNSPSFEISHGGTKRLEYVIRNCSP